MMNKCVLLCFVIFPGLSGFAQTITVTQENATIRNEKGEGFEAVVEGTMEEVTSALSKWMRSFGKVKETGNVLFVDGPVIAGVSYDASIFAQPRQTGTAVAAWMGIKPDEWSKKDMEAVTPELRSQVYDFAVNFHREKIQGQIDESVRAAQAVERQQQRLQNQDRELNAKIENNKREKLRLEKSLENNAVELTLLEQRLATNKKEQDSVAVAGEQIRKVIEMHQQRLQSVN